MFVEYLYTDMGRVDEYVSQINPSGVVIEKGKEWSVGLTYVVPTIQGKQAERVRSMNKHEKIDAIKKYLISKSELLTDRPAEFLEKSGFVLEKCNATKIIVPANATDGVDNPSFVFWLSTGGYEDKRPNLLCLLQDFGLPDNPAMRGYSSYTLLQSIVHHTRKKIEQSVLFDRLPKLNHINPLYKHDDDRLSSYSEEYYSVERYMHDFCHKFTDLLSEWGCIVCQPRQIETLYKIREYGLESGADYKAVSLFAYPIYIAEA